MVPSDDNSASTGFFPFFDGINSIETLPGISDLELLGQAIVTNASGINHGFWWEDVLLVFGSTVRVDVG